MDIALECAFGPFCRRLADTLRCVVQWPGDPPSLTEGGFSASHRVPKPRRIGPWWRVRLRVSFAPRVGTYGGVYPFRAATRSSGMVARSSMSGTPCLPSTRSSEALM